MRIFRITAKRRWRTETVWEGAMEMRKQKQTGRNGGKIKKETRREGSVSKEHIIH